MLEKRSVSGQPRKLLTPSCAHRRRSIERSDRDDGGVPPRPTMPPLLLPNPIKFVERASSSELARFGNASATTPGGLRASLERSWTGAAFAQECTAASPCPSASAGADSLIGYLVAGPTGVWIVEIDLTRIGPVSRTF